MKVNVIGLGHLGCVTAAGLAEVGLSVLALDPDETTIQKLQQNRTKFQEPNLIELMNQHVLKKNLKFSNSLADLDDATVTWFTFDTPLDENGIANTHTIFENIRLILPHLHQSTLIIISSQVPVGFTKLLSEYSNNNHPSKNYRFAYSPENLRLGNALDIFMHPDRIVVGIQNEPDKEKIQELLKPITQNILWMSLESAEMTKHAINGFLATSVIFINELATLCEKVGANVTEVEQGLKTEERIGPKAYLRPGGAIAGGTLLRDINYLIKISEERNLSTPLLSSLLESNQQHKRWTLNKLNESLKNLKHKTITSLGLTYKAGTHLIEGSLAIDTCKWLAEKGAIVNAYDPACKELPQALSFINLKTNLAEALEIADAILISTDWPEFLSLTAEDLMKNITKPLVIDPHGFLKSNAFTKDSRIQYVSLGVT